MRTAVTALCLLALSSNVVVSIPHGQDQANHWRQFEAINENGNNQRSYDTPNIAQKNLERENNHDGNNGGFKKYLHRLVPQNNPEEYGRLNQPTHIVNKAAHTLPVNIVPNPGQGNEDQAARPLTNDNPAYIEKHSNSLKKGFSQNTQKINKTNVVYPYSRKFLIIHNNGTIESTTDFEYIKRTMPNYKILTADQALLQNPSLAKGIKENFSNNPESNSAPKKKPSIIINKETANNEKISVASNQPQKTTEPVFNKPLSKQEKQHVNEGNATHTISESFKNNNTLPIKQYLIVHPNGTVERTTDINYIKKAVPNYTLVDKSKVSSLHPIYQDILKKYYGTKVINKNNSSSEKHTTNPVENIQKSESDKTKLNDLEPATVNSGGWRPPPINVGDIKTSSKNTKSPQPGPRNDLVVDNQHSKLSRKEDGTNTVKNIQPATKQLVTTNLNSTNGWHPPRFLKGSTVDKQHLNPLPKEDGTNPADKNETTKSSQQLSETDKTKPNGLEPAAVNSGGWRPPPINVGDIKTSSKNTKSPQPGPRNDLVVDNQHSKPSRKEDGTNTVKNIQPATKQLVTTNLNSTNGWHPPRFLKGSTVDKQHLNPLPKEDGTNPADKNETTKSSQQLSETDKTKPNGLEPSAVNSGGWRPPPINVGDIKTSSKNSGLPQPGPKNGLVVDNQHSKPSRKEDGTNTVKNIQPATKQVVTTNLNSTNGWHPPRFLKGSTVDKQHLNPLPKEDGTNTVKNIQPATKQVVTTNLNSTNGWHPPRFLKSSTVDKQHLNPLPKEDGTNPADKNKTTKSSKQLAETDKTKPSRKEDGTNTVKNIQPATKQVVTTNLNSTNGWHPPRFLKGSTVDKQHLNPLPKEDGTNPADKNETTKSSQQLSETDKTKPSRKEDGTNTVKNIQPATKQVVTTNLNSTNGWHPPRFLKGSTVDKQHLNPLPKENGSNPAYVDSSGPSLPPIEVSEKKISSTNSGAPRPGPRNDLTRDNENKPIPQTEYVTGEESEPLSSEEYEEVVENTEYVNGQEVKTITVTKYNNAEDADETGNSSEPPFILQLYDAKPGDIVWIPANDENVNSNEEVECIEIDNDNGNDSCS